jgi:serine protease Do
VKEFVAVPSHALARPRPASDPVLSLLWALALAFALLIAQAVAGQARAAPESFADLADKVSPSVVNITTSTTVATPAIPFPNLPEGSPFEDFFRDFGLPGPDSSPDGGPTPGPQPGPSQRSQALGSGFVISEDGYIVTNNHVIEGADEIEIEFFSRARLPATVVGTDPNTDIALLKVQSDTPLPYVSFGDSDIVRVGDWVMAMGNPLGQGFSVSAGIVSARNRELSGTYDDYIQTDAAINRGNSGGPLFNMEGEVIGVNTAILSPNGVSIGIGFAMSAAVVTDVVDQLREFGETRRGWLGVRIQDVSAEIAEAMGLEAPKGALVTEVPEGPAAEAGIEQGDVIVMFDGREVADTRALVRQVAGTAVGRQVPVVVFRDGATRTLQITLGRREDAEGAAPAARPAEEPPPAAAEMMGLTVSAVTPELIEEFGLPEKAQGLVVTAVDEASDAFEKGLRAGDLITEAGQQPVAAPADLEARIEEAREAGRKSLLLLLRRGGDVRFVALSVEN